MTDRNLSRRNKIRSVLSKQKIDVMLVTNPINVRYLSGFTGGDSYLLVKRNGEDILLSDPRFTIQVEEECPGLAAHIRPAGETLPEAVSRTIGRSLFNQPSLGKRGGRLAIEAESLTLAERVRVFSKLADWELVPTQGLVEELRQIKDRSEIALIRKAIDTAFFAFNDVRRKLRADMSEIDIRNELEYRMRLCGAEEKSFPSIIGAGHRAALPHGTPSKLKLVGQSHLLIDWGAIVDGYMSDLTRVLIFSIKSKPINKKLKTIYETVLRAQQAAINAVKPGKTGQEIDAIARNIIKDAGFSKHFNHGLGHSMGLEIHEAPRFAVGHATVLKPGMIMTVEPGIYLKDWGGVRIEDDILITKTGCEVLSRHVPKSFDEMIVDLT